MNWLKKGTPYLPVTLAGKGMKPLSATIERPIGARVMLSTPAAITTSCVPDITACAANWIACCEEPHCRSMVTAGTLCGMLRGQHRIAPDMERLLARLGDAAHDHVVDRGGIDPRPLGDRIEADRGEIDGMDAGEAPAFAAPGGAAGGDDIGFWHGGACAGNLLKGKAVRRFRA